MLLPPVYKSKKSKKYLCFKLAALKNLIIPPLKRAVYDYALFS